MFRPPLPVVLLLGLVLLARPLAAQQGAIVGTWRGTSLCIDREHFPACTDEQVIYEVQPKPGARDVVTLSADKVVGGVRDFMGAFDFALTSDGAWVAEFQSPRTHIRIVLRIDGSHMAGALLDVPSGRQIRQIALDRIPD